MINKCISVRLEDKHLNMIDKYAESRCISRSKAIRVMLENVRIIVVDEGKEVVKYLYSLDILLRNQRLSDKDEKKVEEVCDKLWQLLDLITEKIQSPEEEETN